MKLLNYELFEDVEKMRCVLREQCYNTLIDVNYNLSVVWDLLYSSTAMAEDFIIEILEEGSR